jgi:hypothetical protein
MMPPPWMIEELERRRQEREELERPQLWIEVPEPVRHERPEREPERTRGPVVIDLW